VTSEQRPYREAGAVEPQLGALVGSYAPSRLAAVRAVLVFGVLLLVGFTTLASTLGALDNRSPDVLVFGLLAGMACCLGAVGVAVRWRATRGMHLDVHEHGLSYRVGARETVLLWDDVAEVRVTWTNVRRYLGGCVLVGKDGKRMELTSHLAGIEAIGSTVETESVRRQVPRALAELEAGRTVPFGPFAVSKAGLAHGSRELAWRDVAGAALSDGIIAIGDTERGIRVLPKRGGLIAWAKASYDEVPNAAVLLTLVQQLKGSHDA
jgi:hypothetical protein